MARNYDPDEANMAHVIQLCAGFLREAGLLPSPQSSGMTAVDALENPLAKRSAVQDSRYIALGEAMCIRLRELAQSGAMTSHKDPAGNPMGQAWTLVGPDLYQNVLGLKQPARAFAGGSSAPTVAGAIGTGLASAAAGVAGTALGGPALGTLASTGVQVAGQIANSAPSVPSNATVFVPQSSGQNPNSGGGFFDTVGTFIDGTVGDGDGDFELIEDGLAVIGNLIGF